MKGSVIVFSRVVADTGAIVIQRNVSVPTASARNLEMIIAMTIISGAALLTWMGGDRGRL